VYDFNIRIKIVTKQDSVIWVLVMVLHISFCLWRI